MTIHFNKTFTVQSSVEYIQDALSCQTNGDGEYTKKCSLWFEKQFKTAKALLTTSCTHALEMAACLCNISNGDEVIMPSYTFSSTANAFVGRGAKVVFVDIRPDTMNIDEDLIEAAITNKTKVLVPVHYAGVACEMTKINEIAKKHRLFVIEDAAQAVMSEYQGKACGTFGDFGAFSFHETKNYSMGEGGALLIRDLAVAENAEVIREKGTNRSRFFRGEVDKYSWIGWGSSYLPSELNAAYLWSGLEIAEQINDSRLIAWNHYYERLKGLQKRSLLELPFIPKECKHNAHMFYIKTENHDVQQKLLKYLKNSKIGAVFHYVPLHSSEAGQKFGIFHGEDRFTTKESSRLIRLPMYYGLTEMEIDYVVKTIESFFRG
ncbi:MAG: dTDP-4-amino-4,6-dideoxygalactose transaminase [Oscillospiraceae bacterium]|nr:dTDP-4-amino-4,6-dideoxygalactose transaminase [Oscillospiraceae bacterium]